jgi:hypothetical protein
VPEPAIPFFFNSSLILFCSSRSFPYDLPPYSDPAMLDCLPNPNGAVSEFLNDYEPVLIATVLIGVFLLLLDLLVKSWTFFMLSLISMSLVSGISSRLSLRLFLVWFKFT